jgi:hypothetical protein
MKAVCIIASDNVLVDGDVVFCKLKIPGWHIESKKNITICNCWLLKKFSKKMPMRLKMLWFWHMVVLRKSHVYLVGVMK